jgi:hypothetical protein
VLYDVMKRTDEEQVEQINELPVQAAHHGDWPRQAQHVRFLRQRLPGLVEQGQQGVRGQQVAGHERPDPPARVAHRGVVGEAIAPTHEELTRL